LFVCKCVLPPGDNPIAVNKYHIIYHSLQNFISVYLCVSFDSKKKQWLFPYTTLTLEFFSRKTESGCLLRHRNWRFRPFAKRDY